MNHELEAQRVDAIQRVDDARQKILHIIQLSYQNWQQKLHRLATHLNALSPSAVLQRGYSITCNAEGKIIRSVESLRQKQSVKTLLADGAFESEITTINKEMEHIWQTKRQMKME
jgi:exodeoxyribonuclease VII large subunit